MRSFLKNLTRLLQQQVSFINDEINEINRQTDFIKDMFILFPFVVGISYFFYANNIAFYLHNVGSYGIDEEFMLKTMPIVQDVLNGNLSRLTIGVYGPLYPLVIALKTMFGNKDIFKAALFINAFAAGSIIIFSHLLVRLLFGNKVAFLCTVLMVVNAKLFELTYTASSGLLFFVFIVVSLYFLFLWFGGKSNRHLFFSAIFCSLSTLIYAGGLVVFIGVPPSIYEPFSC
ncbi:MAG: hypothetical protein V1913_00560 [Fibrobacterota bacterium]